MPRCRLSDRVHAAGALPLRRPLATRARRAVLVIQEGQHKAARGRMLNRRPEPRSSGGGTWARAPSLAAFTGAPGSARIQATGCRAPTGCRLGGSRSAPGSKSPTGPFVTVGQSEPDSDIGPGAGDASTRASSSAAAPPPGPPAAAAVLRAPGPGGRAPGPPTPDAACIARPILDRPDRSIGWYEPAQTLTFMSKA